MPSLSDKAHAAAVAVYPFLLLGQSSCVYHSAVSVMQYADFLRLALDKVTYRDLLPPLADLLDPEKYGLEPEVAFLLYRPVLSRVPFPAPPSAKDEEDGEIPEGDQAPMEVEQGEATILCKL